MTDAAMRTLLGGYAKANFCCTLIDSRSSLGADPSALGALSAGTHAAAVCPARLRSALGCGPCWRRLSG